MTKLEQLKNVIKPFVAMPRVNGQYDEDTFDTDIIKALCPIVSQLCSPGHCRACWNAEIDDDEN